MDYQDYHDPSMKITVVDGHRQGRKSKNKYASRSSIDDQAMVVMGGCNTFAPKHCNAV